MTGHAWDRETPTSVQLPLGKKGEEGGSVELYQQEFHLFSFFKKRGLWSKYGKNVNARLISVGTYMSVILFSDFSVCWNSL